jgi:hypothetical protein
MSTNHRALDAYTRGISARRNSTSCSDRGSPASGTASGRKKEPAAPPTPWLAGGPSRVRLRRPGRDDAAALTTTALLRLLVPPPGGLLLLHSCPAGPRHGCSSTRSQLLADRCVRWTPSVNLWRCGYAPGWALEMLAQAPGVGYMYEVISLSVGSNQEGSM